MFIRDPAYLLHPHLQAPFRGNNLTNDQIEWNKSMSAVRVSVEWIFGDIINYFKFMDLKKKLKIGLSAVGKMYLICGLLHNAWASLYKTVTSKYFDISPPSLGEYFIWNLSMVRIKGEKKIQESFWEHCFSFNCFYFSSLSFKKILKIMNI